MRGLACRRSGTPPLIQEVQLEMLALVAQANMIDERAERILEATSLLHQRIEEIKASR